MTRGSGSIVVADHVNLTEEDPEMIDIESYVCNCLVMKEVKVEPRDRNGSESDSDEDQGESEDGPGTSSRYAGSKRPRSGGEGVVKVKRSVRASPSRGDR